MKRLLLSLQFLCLLGTTHAQMQTDGNILYGNEWIDYSQSYYKMYVEEDGVYRIPYQTLVNAGVPLSSITADGFQLYAMGEEIPLYTSAQGTLSNSDYIEFYGRKNMGELDAHFHENSEGFFNPYYSMYTDTSAYFLTWNTTSNNNRLQEIPNDLNNLPAPESYFMHESYKVSSLFYNKGEAFEELYESRFSDGEGYGSYFIQTGDYAVPTPNVYNGGGDAQYWIRFASSNSANHQIQLKVGNVQQPIDSANFSGYQMRQITGNVPNNLLGTTSTTVRLKGMLNAADRHSTSFAKIEYPREFVFGNENSFSFKVSGDAANRKYLEIEDFDHGGVAPILFDLTNGLCINTTLNGSTVQVALPISTEERKLILFNRGNSVTTIDEIFESNFVNYDVEQGDYIIVSHDKFISDPGNQVQNYAAYRASTGYNPIIVDVEELYDQFAYGVNKHAQAIRNFTGFSLANWATPPKYMFMIGKARPYFSIRNNQIGQPSYTPTFGHSTSDVLLTATPQSDVPRIAFGRIPVLQANEVGIYLNKVISYENNQNNLPQTIEDRAWMKRVVHLGGGDPFIQETIKDNFNNYSGVVENDHFGADVSSFFKSNDAPVEIITSELLDSFINEGTKMVTFYGHSSPEALDFNIDGPENYTNLDRYFIMFSLGCYSGQIHQKEPNISEWFVFAEEKGAVAFLATVDLSEIESLDAFADAFYEKMTGDNYGEGLGDIVRAAIESQQSAGALEDDRIVYQQMTLNGDPAIRINATEAPDYIVNEQTIQFGPAMLTNEDDIELSFSIMNIGKAISDSFNIQIDRILPNGTEITVIEAAENTPKFEQSYRFTIPSISTASGLNQFRITIDVDDDIAEMPNPDAEDNNVAYGEATILTNVIEPLTPRDFSILPDLSGIILKAAIETPYINTSLNYLMEIDTTELFDSPLKESTNITSTIGDMELKWAPSISYTDSTVYYWRVRADDPQVPTAADWRGYSFVTINNEYPGWNQSHYYQFKKDRFENMNYGEDRRFDFVSTYNEIAVTSAHYPILPPNQLDYSVNGSRIYDAIPCEVEEQGMYFAFFDEDFNVYGNVQLNSATNQGLYGTYLCNNQTFAFLFRTNTLAGQNNLRNVLNNTIPNFPYVKYILIYSLNDYEPETWNADLFDAFANYGLTDIQNTVTLGGVPYAGLIEIDSGNAYEQMAATENDILEAAFALEESWMEGKVKSTLIGPATEWVSLHWQTSEQEADDEVQVNVYGVNTNNEEVFLETVTDSDHVFDAAIYDITVYPQLRLEYEAVDEVNRTATQLDYWRVLYDDCFKINVKVNLEGPYDVGSGLMNTNLNTERKLLPGQIPTAPTAIATPAGQPYNLPPWNYTGIEGSDFTDESYAESVVDWVMVSLRTEIDPATEVLRTTGLLLKNGIIDIVEPCVADPALIGDFYIVIEHRNHLGMMSPQKVAVVNNQITYDFRAANSYINNGIGFGQKELTPGVWGMYGADIDQAADPNSYDINSIDKVQWVEENGIFDVYLHGDLNLDGDVNALDKIFWESNNGTFSSVPK